MNTNHQSSHHQRHYHIDPDSSQHQSNNSHDAEAGQHHAIVDRVTENSERNVTEEVEEEPRNEDDEEDDHGDRVPEEAEEEDEESNEGVVDAEVEEVTADACGRFRKAYWEVKGLKFEELRPWTACGHDGLHGG
ncbi:unnamed protein product [Rhodiola kirilowii]